MEKPAVPTGEQCTLQGPVLMTDTQHEVLTGTGPENGGLSAPSQALLEVLPAPIWVEDWTAVETFCTEQRNAGCTDLRAVLRNDEALLRSVVSSIVVNAANDHAARFVGAESQTDLLGQIPADLFQAPALESALEQILVVWEGGSRFRLDFAGNALDGEKLDTQLEWAAPLVDGKPDYSQIAILMRDVSEERAAERQMRRNVQKLETLLDTGRGISSTFDIGIILELLAETTAELLGAEQTLILLFDTAAERITHRTTHGTFDVAVPEPTFSEIMNRIPGWVTRTREATLSADLAADERTLEMPPPLDWVFAGRRAAVAPILADDRVLGTLTAMNGPSSPEFTTMDLSLVRMLAMQAAVAISNAELYEELRESRDTVQAAHEELKVTQTQLLSAQKMEAIGGLAAGIAHEINTPIQFVSDNTAFIRDASVTLGRFEAEHTKILDQLTDHPELGGQIQQLRDEWKAEDCDFLIAELPDAIAETIEGTQRVAEIVKAMKEFAHPGSKSKTTVDVNRVMQTTMQVSRNEWKYVADIELDLDETLPVIEGHPGPLGQSMLIMIVNAAQAMAEHRDVDTKGKGVIKLATSHTDEIVEIRISDNGPGIPEGVIKRIFEPFFTTKEVGKGSGQGLSIAHSVVVDKHQGEIWVENTNPGASFVIQLPIEDPQRAKSAS